MDTTESKLMGIYERLLAHFGTLGWWPAQTRFEVCVGAILTQATAWRNVEKAIENLKTEGLLSLAEIKDVRLSRLSRLIRPALYHNIKAKKLKSFIRFVYDNYGGDLNKLLGLPKDRLRQELLGVWGIGPETADSIILYAACKPSFVVDAYTMRIFARMGLLKPTTYDETKEFFEANLSKSTKLYNEYHALIVELGKNYCRRKPICDECPVTSMCKKNV